MAEVYKLYIIPLYVPVHIDCLSSTPPEAENLLHVHVEGNRIIIYSTNLTAKHAMHNNIIVLMFNYCALQHVYVLL